MNRIWFERQLLACDASMRRLAYRLVGGDVDDVLQDAYLSAFANLGDFRAGSRFDTWLYRIVYNTCLNHLRRRGRHVPMTDETRLAAADDPARLGTARVDLASALAELPVDQRAAVLLVDAEDLSYREAARVLDLPVGTVASRVNRARASLRRYLEEPA